MSDGFEKDLRDHLHREAAQAKDLPSALPGRVRHGIESGGRFTPVQQLALVAAMVIFVAAVGFLVVQLKGSRGSVPAQSGFACANRSGGNPNLSSNLRIVRVSPQGGFDRVTFEFDGPIAGYQVELANSLATTVGAGFVRVSLRHAGAPAAGIVTAVDPGPRVITGVSQLSTDEQATLFGINLATAVCNRVSELQNPARLVVDFVVPAVFKCNTATGGEQGGGPFALTGIGVQPEGNTQTGFYDHLVFSFDSATPIYAVIPQSSATFSRYDGSTVTLLGSSGVRLKLGNVRNTDLSKITWSMAGGGPSPAKTSPTDFTPNLSIIKEVAVLDNSQGTIQVGIGLGSAACFRVTEQGKTLAIDFQTGAQVAQVPFQVRQLSFADTLHGWALGTASKGTNTYLILARTTDGGTTWRYLPQSPMAGNTTAAADRWGIHFDSPEDGWIYGPAAYVTHDGGATWLQTDLMEQVVALSANGTSAWAAVQFNCAKPLCPLRLATTADGQHWSVPARQPTLVGPEAQFVRVSAEIGWVLSWRQVLGGAPSSLAVTHDGGDTWQTLTTPCAPATSLEDRMAALDDRTIWVVCGGGPSEAGNQQKQLITSTDGGLHWNYPPNPPEGGNLQSLALSGPTSGVTGWLAAAHGPLYVTIDRGRTWSPADTRGVRVDLAGSGAIEVIFTDPLHGWAATSDEIFRTTDGGGHWSGVPAEALEGDTLIPQASATAIPNP